MIIPLLVELSAALMTVMASIQCSGVIAAAWIEVTIREYSSIVTIATSCCRDFNAEAGAVPVINLIVNWLFFERFAMNVDARRGL
jgi:hypothetical protein